MTYVQGVPLPASPVSAAWSNVTPGCGGRLTVSGPAVSGTTTVATGGLTSRWFRPDRGHLLTVFAEQGGDRHFRPLPEGFALSMRVREQGHRWTRWWTMSMTTEPSSPPLPDLLFQYSIGFGLTVVESSRKGRPLPLQQVQFGIKDRITSTATVDDEFAVAVGCP